MRFKVVLLTIFIQIAVFSISAQTTEFTYQGSLKDGANPANGNYDFEFRLFDAVSGGSQIGSVAARNGVAVANGIFAVMLDFGNGFPGPDRFIEIRVRNAGGGGHTTLDPRQRVNSSPYAVKSLSADNAATATTAANATNAQNAVNATNATNAANATTATTANSLSASCVGCVTAAQIGSVNGSSVTGTIPVASVPAGSGSYVQNQSAGPQAASSFNISGSGTAGGTLSGAMINAATQYNINGSRILGNPGTDNIFVGIGAGQMNTTGSGNSFFGRNAGDSNTQGSNNAFFGSFAGQANTTGLENSFFGRFAGGSNTTGERNSFFGRSAGSANTTGDESAFFGAFAGDANTTGFRNSFFGTDAGRFNTTGGSNAFFGGRAGISNTTGGSNAFFGASAGDSNTTGNSNAFFGASAGGSNTLGISNSFFGRLAGSNSTGDENTFLGTFAGESNFGGSSNTMIGYGANPFVNNLTYATALGAGSLAIESSSVTLGRSADIVYIPGFLRLLQLGGAGSTAVCRNNANTIGTCSSSLRYKTNIGHFGRGLSLINQLKPITFDWKDGGMHDLGLGAEDVAAIEPLLVTYNEKGQVEGVKYDRIGVVLINAFKEQQTQIDEQKTQIDEQRKTIAKQQSDIDALRSLLCVTNKEAAVCKEK